MTVKDIRGAINGSKDGWRTAAGVANELGLEVSLVKTILEGHSWFLQADALNTRFYTTKERYFRLTNAFHVILDFLCQKVTI